MRSENDIFVYWDCILGKIFYLLIREVEKVYKLVFFVVSRNPFLDFYRICFVEHVNFENQNFF